ncbi:MAG: hypothetical protein ACHRHE_13105, partial [Tepidisphaerales bacterium]
MRATMPISHLMILAAALLLGSGPDVFGQAEMNATGSLRGIRVDGELMAFRTGIRAVTDDAPQAGPGRGGPGGQFSRDGNTLMTRGSLTGGAGGPGGMPGRGGPGAAGTSYQATFRDVAPGVVDAQVQITSSVDAPMVGVYFSITLRGTDYAGGTAQLIDSVAPAAPVSLAATRPAAANTYLRAAAKGVHIAAPRRQLEITLATAQEVVVQDSRGRGNGDIEITFPLSLGKLIAGQTARS